MVWEASSSSGKVDLLMNAHRRQMIKAEGLPQGCTALITCVG
jgi:hypothetical protein